MNHASWDGKYRAEPVQVYTWVRRVGTKLVRFRSEAAVRVGLNFKEKTR